MLFSALYPTRHLEQTFGIGNRAGPGIVYWFLAMFAGSSHCRETVRSTPEKGEIP
jgi:hypothetical protein